MLATVPEVWVGGGTAAAALGPASPIVAGWALGYKGIRAGTSLQPRVQMLPSQGVQACSGRPLSPEGVRVAHYTLFSTPIRQDKAETTISCP